jgi:DNA polymerase II small subunit/DNA polymerase delta subunit B
MNENQPHFEDFENERNDMQINPPPIRMEKPDALTPIGFDRHFERIQELQAIKKETSLWKDEITVNVDTGKLPYMPFRPLSDTHIGSAGVDMKELRKHLDDIKNSSLITAMVGDIGDFFGPMAHPEGMMGDVITPDDQLSALRRFFEEYQDKMMCTVQDPSHTDWIRQKAGIEPQRYLVENLQIPALKSGGLVRLIVNGIEYKILMFHQIGKFGSSLNITNAGKRMLDMAKDVDIVFSGHTHIGAMEKVVKRDGKPYIVQFGTFKTDDDFGTRKGLVPKPQVFFPTIFFGSKVKNIECIENRETAMDMMDALNRKYR